jgi:hypothetical protein
LHTSLEKEKKFDEEIGVNIVVQELTKGILDSIVKNQLESIAEFKIYFRPMKKDKKSIQTKVM